MGNEPFTVDTPDGVTLSGRIFGPTDRPAIVMVHGYPDNQTVWDSVARDLADNYRVVTYDVRGAGQSSAPRSSRHYKLPRLAADLKLIIEHVSPDASVHVVGHDWGSIQAWQAATDPDASRRMASFTSISGPCLDHVGHWARTQFPGSLRQLPRSWYIAGMHIPWASAALWQVLAPRWTRLLQRLDSDHPDGPGDSRQRRRDGIQGIRLYRANVLPRLLNPAERPCPLPVQLIIPREDPFVSPAMARAAMPWCDRIQVEEIPGSHWVISSNPAAVADRINRYCNNINQGNRRKTNGKRVDHNA